MGPKQKGEKKRVELLLPRFLLAAVYKALLVCPFQIWASSLDKCPAPFLPLACRWRQKTTVIKKAPVLPEVATIISMIYQTWLVLLSHASCFSLPSEQQELNKVAGQQPTVSYWMSQLCVWPLQQRMTYGKLPILSMQICAAGCSKNECGHLLHGREGE